MEDPTLLAPGSSSFTSNDSFIYLSLACLARKKTLQCFFRNVFNYTFVVKIHGYLCCNDVLKQAANVVEVVD